MGFSLRGTQLQHFVLGRKIRHLHQYYFFHLLARQIFTKEGLIFFSYLMFVEDLRTQFVMDNVIQYLSDSLYCIIFIM